MKILKYIIIVIIVIFITDNIFAARLKIATLSPEGSFWMQKMREGAKEVKKRTQNRVRIKYYPGGVMGDERAVLRKIRIGQLEGAAVVAGSLSDIYSDNQIYGLPLKFRSFDEVDYVRKKIDPIIIKGLEKGGFIAFGLAEGGFAYIMSRHMVKTIGDFRERKVWIPNNDLTILEGIKAFSISPIPLSIADVRAGLQTGIIDTVATSPIGAIALQWHTQIKYIMDVPFLYVYAVLGVDKKAFMKIKPDDRKIVRQVMGSVFSEIDKQNRQDNIKAMAALKNQGIRFLKPGNAAMEQWYEAASKVPERLIKAGRFSREIVDMLETSLKEYRAGKKN